MIRSFSDLKKNLKLNDNGLKKISIAVLADSASQHFTVALKSYGVERKLSFEIYEADYDQMDLLVFDSESELYTKEFDFIILFHCVQKLYSKFVKTDLSNRMNFSERHIQNVNQLVESVKTQSKAKVIYLNFPETDDGVFGNFSNKIENSWIYQLRKINFRLMDLSREKSNLYISDMTLLKSHWGDETSFDPRLHVHGDLAFNIDFLTEVARNLTDIIQTLSGNFKKCLILDLDNTTWGGIIGDDGMENIQVGDLGIGKAFTKLQYWAKELKSRGIILAVCSKNTEHIAKEPFEKHPEMVLRLEDIAVFVANWENKVDNIKFIQSVLNIGFDSMVFLDDNKFERNLVRDHLPDVTVPELPEDPTEYLSFIQTLNLFETASISEEDSMRTQQYKEESERIILKQTFNSEADYLSDLEMTAEIRSFDKFSIPRVAQLTQRSNQFNLRTVRYNESDIEAINSDKNKIGFSISLTDKFGEYGLISVIVLEKRNEVLFIDSWLMSCRVLKRTVERFTLNEIIEIAVSNRCKKVIGEYIPTSKNGLVKDHYESLGFKNENGNLWSLDVDTFIKPEFYIKKK